MTDTTIELTIQRLAEAAAPSISAPPYLAERLLARRGRRWRRTGALGLALVAASGVVAVRSGNSRYFDEYEPSGSMLPTVEISGSVTADRRLAPVDQDLAVVRASYRGTTFTTVRRVMGTAGDTIGCPGGADGRCHAWVRNGQALDEPYTQNLVREPVAAVTVPTGQLYVLGDARDNAVDSTFYGVLPAKNVLGTVVQIRSAAGLWSEVPGAPSHDHPTHGVDTDPQQGPGPAATAAPAG